MSLKVLLSSGRTLKQGIGVEAGKSSLEYLKETAVIMLNKEDATSLGVKDGDLVTVKTDVGEITVSCKIDDKLPKGMAFMPYGPWINMLVRENTEGTGIARFKSIEAEVRKGGEKIPSLEDLAKILKG